MFSSVEKRLALPAVALAWTLATTGPAAQAAPGSTAANFLKDDAFPRPVSLGGAYAAVSDDAHAVSHNPAGLAFLERKEAAFLHSEQAVGIQQEYLALAFPSRRLGTLALSAQLLRVKPFDAFDDQDRPIGRVSAQDLAAGAAWARNWGPLALGVQARRLISRLADVEASGAAFDAGALLRRENGWAFGAAVRNIGRDFRFLREPFPLPLEGRLGASYSLEAAGKWRFLFTGESAFPRDRGPYLSAGVEAGRTDLGALRLGWRGSQDAGLGIAAGIGFKLLHRGFNWYSYSEFPSTFPDLDFDYAFVDFGGLGNVHRFSLLARFGRGKGWETRTPEPDERSRMLYYGN